MGRGRRAVVGCEGWLLREVLIERERLPCAERKELLRPSDESGWAWHVRC
jgi:hypothetical protein